MIYAICNIGSRTAGNLFLCEVVSSLSSQSLCIHLSIWTSLPICLAETGHVPCFYVSIIQLADQTALLVQ
ncbi:unnamed protein product [Penicillium roqueforti FM164]|uniref:Genomic scaffold, ProqFM164S01 n=1 Tax=Penicillium roqueforti (strain FM164) TaxID=1365484 RepID=W6Q313_PENRF|nr:unnamed protein product [Penicillium roqueforti FM164]